MKYFNLFILIFVFLGVTNAQNDRDVYWLHGFTGEPSNVDQYANKYASERQMTSRVPGYESEGTIDEITNGLSESITSNPRNFAVGHSLGGIVSRNLEIEGDESEINGYITLHSPNQGANVTAAVRSGEAEDFLINVSRQVSRSLNEIETHLGGWINIINVVAQGINVVLGVFDWAIWFNGNQWGWDGIEQPNAEDVLDGFNLGFDLLTNPQYEQIVNDLTPDGDFMNRLNSFNSNLPSIEVHGFEEGPELLRLLCSGKKGREVWNRPLATTQPYPDDCVIEEIDEALRGLNDAYNALRGKATVLSLIGFGQRNHEAARRVWEARRTIRSLNTQWLGLIGSAYEIIQVEHRSLNDDCQSHLDRLNRDLEELLKQPDFEDPNNNSSGGPTVLELLQKIQDILNDENCYDTFIEDVYVQVNGGQGELNDGFILEREQTTGNADLTYRNERVNHWEVLNHPQMMAHFEDMWTNGGYFITPER